MSRRDPLRIRDYLGHILQSAANIVDYTTGMTREIFLADSKTQDAVIRNLEVIGEACNRIVTRHPEFADAHPAVPWTAAYGMRNALSHGYFKVDRQVVWTTVRNDLPLLVSAVQEALGDAN